VQPILHAIQPVRHIALKQWAEDFDMETVFDSPAHRLLRDGDTRVVLFRAGVICFFEAGPALQARVIARIQSTFQPIPEPHVEELPIRLGERDGVSRDGVVLKAWDDERLLLVALRLAQSLALELHEEAVEALLETRRAPKAPLTGVRAVVFRRGPGRRRG